MKPSALLFALLPFCATAQNFADDFELPIPAGVARLPESDAYDAAVKTARAARHNACLPTSPAIGPCLEDPANIATWRAALTKAGAACWQVPQTDTDVATARAAAFAANGQCKPSSVVPPPVLSVPGAPASISAAAGIGSAIVTFAAVTSATSYSVSVVSGGIGRTATGPASPITVPGLPAGGSYQFAVQAVNSAGTGPMSGWSNPVTPQ